MEICDEICATHSNILQSRPICSFQWYVYDNKPSVPIAVANHLQDIHVFSSTRSFTSRVSEI
jgi:hypothetical protein